MKIYALFGGECYYAKGGFNDLVKLGNDVLALTVMAQKKFEPEGHYHDNWWQIVDLETGKIILTSDRKPYGSKNWSDV